MMTTDKAYDKFYKLLNQIETDIPPSEQYELYQDMESEIEQKKATSVCGYARVLIGKERMI